MCEDIYIFELQEITEPTWTFKCHDKRDGRKPLTIEG